MPPASEWDEDGLVRIGTFAKMTDFSPGYITGLFDLNVFPGMRCVKGTQVERRINRRFAAELLAAIRHGSEVVDLVKFAADWKAAQADRRAA